MKARKNLIMGGVAALVIAGIGWYVTTKDVVNGGDVYFVDPSVLYGTATPTTPIVESTVLFPFPIALDYSKLTGKDRLYTEEEGAYKNLNEEEKKLIQKIIIPEECQMDIENADCSKGRIEQYAWMIEHSNIALLYDGILMLRVVNYKGGTSYHKYSIVQLLRDDVGISYQALIRSDSLIIIDKPTSEGRSLSYFKFGMNQFMPWSQSALVSNQETYHYPIGMGFADFEGVLTNASLTLSIFPTTYPDGEKVRKIRDVTFDLSTLPSPSSSVPENELTWATYQSKELGISFSYPIEYLTQPIGILPSHLMTTGELFQAQFTFPSGTLLSVTSITPDYTAPRDGNWVPDSGMKRLMGSIS